MTGQIIGIAGGIAASLIAALLLFHWQFRHSTAGHRVELTATATRDIRSALKDKEYLGPLRNQYRYLLGVTINEILETFGAGEPFKENGPWPCLFDPPKDHGAPTEDRWDYFNARIRPVLEDTNHYSFLAFFWFLSFHPRRSRLRQLGALTKLCNQLEIVVAVIDAAYEVHAVTLDDNKHIVLANSGEHCLQRKVRTGYKVLHDAWTGWLDSIDVC